MAGENLSGGPIQILDVSVLSINNALAQILERLDTLQGLRGPVTLQNRLAVSDAAGQDDAVNLRLLDARTALLDPQIWLLTAAPDQPVVRDSLDIDNPLLWGVGASQREGVTEDDILRPLQPLLWLFGNAGEAAAAAAGGPAGASGDVQYNNGAGAFGAEAALNYDFTNNHLTVPGLTATEDLAFNSVLSPPLITANQNNYNPAGLATATVLRVATDADRTITGLAGGYHGRVLFLWNTTGFVITLTNNDTASLADNRFILPDAFSRRILAYECIALQYDATGGVGNSTWRTLGVDVTRAGGWVDGGTQVELIVPTDNVSIGSSVGVSPSKVTVTGQAGNSIVTIRDITSPGPNPAVARLQFTLSQVGFATTDAAQIVADVANSNARLTFRTYTSGAIADDFSINSGVITFHRPVSFSGTTTFTAILSPAQIIADVNDYNPTNLSTATVLRLSSDASRNITGLAGGSSGRTLFVFNVGANPLVLINESVSSTAANRFAINADYTLAANTGTIVWYDSTSSRWRMPR